MLFGSSLFFLLQLLHAERNNLIKWSTLVELIPSLFVTNALDNTQNHNTINLTNISIKSLLRQEMMGRKEAQNHGTMTWIRVF